MFLNEQLTFLDSHYFSQMNSAASAWRHICVLDEYGLVVKDYPLDVDARHLSKLKRQKRRDLNRMTGKRLKDESLESSANPNPSAQESWGNSDRSSSSQYETTSEDEPIKQIQMITAPIEDILSIEWLLNTKIPV